MDQTKQHTMIIEIPKDAKCRFKACEQPATMIACGSPFEKEGHPDPYGYCETHAKTVVWDNVILYGQYVLDRDQVR